jgi:two-component system invasion response regulator UvrY
MPVRLIIADDHPIIRKGLREIVSETTDLVVADEASSGAELLEKLAASGYDCDLILLDISMPGINGFDVLKRVREDRPGLPVLMLSIHTEERYAMRALKAGASGYLTKGSAAEELITAIRRILQGKKYVSASLAEKIVYRITDGSDIPAHEILSDREYQIFRMIAEGKKPAEIAESLFISAKTVGTYRSRILQKMGFRGTSDIIRYAVDMEIVN